MTAREREIIAAHAPCRTAPNGTGAQCSCDFACANYWLRAARTRQVSWVPKAPASVAMTRPMPVAPARPYAPPVQGRTPLDHDVPQWPGMRPVIGDLMQEKYPMPAMEPEAPAPAEAGQPLALRWLEAGEAAGRESTGLPYTEPGWTGIQISQWVANGEWELLRPALLSGYERNAAAESVALVRNRARIAEAIALGCAGLGLPHLADPLLRRTSEITDAAREAAAMAGGAR